MRSLFLSALLAATAAGCATVRPAESFAPVRDSLGERGVARVEWRGVTASDRAVDEAVGSMLRGELDADRAVQIALLNNRKLQATYEDLGVAQADLVEAGLLHNPVFDLTVRWPDESPRTANVEVAVVQDFLDVFFIPARKRIARAELDAATMRVAHEVTELAGDVREAFYELQAARQLAEMFQTSVAAADAGAETARRLRAAGNITELALAEHESLAAQARLELLSAESEVNVARERLARLMGASGSDARWTVATRLPELPPTDPPGDRLEALAASQRLDVLAARGEVESTARGERLANATRYLSEVEIGAEAERETDGAWLVGPTVSAPIPLFDQGQASLARARARHRQSRQRYLAAVNEARADVRTAHARLAAARSRVEHSRAVVLPLRAKVVEQAQREYNAMLIGVFELLEAKRAQIEAGREYVEALRDYWIARGELERAVGGKLVDDVEPRPAKPQAADPVAPATAPSTQPHDPHQHHHHGD